MKIKLLPCIAFIMITFFAACNNPFLPEEKYDVTITVSVQDKIYDGTTKATVIGGKIFGVLEGDKVTVIAGTADFEDANVGMNKTVNFSGWSIGGEDAGKYVLRSQPKSVKANIFYPSSPISISRTTFTPLSGENTAVITVIGLDMNIAVINCTTAAGLTFNSAANTVTYDGTTSFNNPGTTLIFSVNAGSITANIPVQVYDGQADYTAGNPDRRIPVTQANIQAFNNYANTPAGAGKHYKLAENITLTGTNNWTPINSFNGSFDGQGYIISKIIINTTSNNQGMFGVIATNGIVRDTGITGCDIRGGNNVGSIAGENNGTVLRCYAADNVINGNNLGGLVGTNNRFVQNCYTKGAVGIELTATGQEEGINTKDYVGGITGKNSGTVQNCYVTGRIIGSYWVGGVAGQNSGTVQNCYVTGSVRGVNNYIGGIAGQNITGGSVRDCVALNPKITVYNASTTVGRIAGQNLSGTLTNNHARNMTMTVNDSNVSNVSVVSNPADIHGATVDYDTYYANQGFWFNSPMLWDFGTANAAWEWSSIKGLPILIGLGGQ